MQIQLHTTPSGHARPIQSLTLSLILLACLSCGVLAAGSTSADPVRFTRLSIEDGLSQSSVTAILQDHNGFIWLGTGSGLNRYDGYSVTSFHTDASDSTTLSNDFITCLFEDSRGVLWVGTNRGLNILDSTGHGFKHLFPNPQAGAINSRNHITGIYESPAGRYWISTFRGLGQFDEVDGFTYWFDYTPGASAGNLGSLSHGEIYSMTGDPAGFVWLATRYGLNRVTLATGKIQSYLIDSDDSVGTTNMMSRVWIETDHSLVVGTYGTGLFSFAPDRGTFTPLYRDQLGVRNSSTASIEGILRDEGGQLWVGTREGIFRFNADGSFLHLEHNDADDESLSDNITLVLYADRAATVWAGTQTGGVSRVNRKRKFLHYHRRSSDPHPLSNDLVWSAAQDSAGKIWIGTDMGLNRFDDPSGGGAFTQFLYKPNQHNSLLGGTAQALAVDHDGTLWIGTEAGLQSMNTSTGRFTSYTHSTRDSNSITSNAISALLVDHSGNLWIGTGDGLNVRMKGENMFRHYMHSLTDTTTIAGYKFQAIFEDHDGGIWVGTPAAGISRLDPKTGKFRFFHTSASIPTSVSSNYILCFGEDASGTVWVGTDAGLNKFDSPTGTFRRYTVHEGLPNNVVYSIMQDGKGRLWFSTNRGVGRIDPASGAIRLYDVGDGLQSNEFNTGACAKLRDGRMVLGGVRGFNIFDPDRITDNSVVPGIVITGFSLLDAVADGHTVSLRDQGDRGVIHLSYLQNYFSIQFVGLEYSDPARIQYQYSMEGFRGPWVDAGNRREAVYSNLDPGSYTFRVKAANSDGVWNNTAASLTIVIEPPFWQQWWFRALAVFMIVGGIVSVNNLRVRRKIRLALELERIRHQENASVRKKAGDDFHDEFGHKLTRIAILGEVVKHLMNGETSEIKNNLDKIIETSADLSVGMRDFLWTLNPDAESARDFAIRLKDFGDDFFSKTGVDFHMDTLGENLDGVKLPVDWRRHCILLGKEAMNNCLKHARCTTVHVRVAITGKVLSIEIRDNGTGFNPALGSRGQGLASMRQRAEKVGGTLTIQSVEGTGTTLRFEGTLPVQSQQERTAEGQR